MCLVCQWLSDTHTHIYSTIHKPIYLISRCRCCDPWLSCCLEVFLATRLLKKPLACEQVRHPWTFSVSCTQRDRQDFPESLSDASTDVREPWGITIQFFGIITSPFHSDSNQRIRYHLSRRQLIPVFMSSLDRSNWAKITIQKESCWKDDRMTAIDLEMHRRVPSA